MASTLLELAEEPGLWLPPEPGHDVVLADGYCLVFHGRSAWVHRIRLDEAAVDRAVAEVRALVRERGLDAVSWWCGERSTPRHLPALLEAHGLGPDDPAEMTTLTIASAPAGEPAVEVRKVASANDYLTALELDWAAFDVPPEERRERRAAAGEAWPAIAADGRASVHLAYLDGVAVGFGRVVFTPSAGLLLGGATAPAARGRGVYTALVHARWHEAVARGVPRLVVAAGPMSAPILERLGFEQLGRVRLLRDRSATTIR